MIHFLHIGKTGGTALRNALAEADGRDKILIHGHQVRLADVPVGDKVVFFLRHPVSRFISAFYSRFRQGRPMTFRPWKPAEEVAFTRFATARALAEALSSSDEGEQRAAEIAMREIGHVKSSFYDWVQSDAYFRERSGDILFIGLQETFEADIDLMRLKGLVPQTALLPTDEAKAHRMPSCFDASLSERAVTNLQSWYAADIAFYQACLAWRRQRWPDSATPE